MTDHPTITPPRELMRQWREQAPRYRDGGAGREEWLMERAAQWGCVQRGEVNEAQLQQARDEELKECCEWLKRKGWEYIPDALRAARRPKPQTLSSIALQTLDTIERDAHYLPEITDTIRRAILRLKQLEDSNG